MSQIFVITHNGKPVSEGGLRAGYMVGGNTFVDLYGNPSVALTQPAATPKAPEAPRWKWSPQQQGVDSLTGEIEYHYLPRVLDENGMCSRCKQTPNTNRQPFMTNMGITHNLIVCSTCGQKMLPYWS